MIISTEKCFYTYVKEKFLRYLQNQFITNAFEVKELSSHIEKRTRNNFISICKTHFS